MTSPLRVDVTSRREVVEVAVTGEVDMATADELHDALSRAIADGPAALRLDLSRVTFMDSSGLAVLVDVRRSVVAGGATVCISAAAPQVRRLLAITHLTALFADG